MYDVQRYNGAEIAEVFFQVCSHSPMHVIYTMWALGLLGNRLIVTYSLNKNYRSVSLGTPNIPCYLHSVTFKLVR